MSYPGAEVVYVVSAQYQGQHRCASSVWGIPEHGRCALSAYSIPARRQYMRSARSTQARSLYTKFRCDIYLSLQRTGFAFVGCTGALKDLDEGRLLVGAGLLPGFVARLRVGLWSAPRCQARTRRFYVAGLSQQTVGFKIISRILKVSNIYQIHGVDNDD